MNLGNLNLRWAELFLDGFAAAGGREVVLSPGSRSTPLALAAARHGGLSVAVVVDERSAGFFALGHARVSGRPALAACTSGSAGAHYFPAVMEAAEADLPLILVTADRPPELLDRQAAQTSRQAALFGAHARTWLDLGTPDSDPRALAGARVAGMIAFARALDPRPGPVHVNAPFRKPLEPAAEDEDDRRVSAAALRLCRATAPFLPPGRAADTAAVSALAAACRAARQGLILCGPGPLAQGQAGPALMAVAGRLGFPVLAEAASQFLLAELAPPGVLGHLELLAPSMPFADGERPDLVIQVGRPPISAAWGRWLEGPEAAPRWVVAAHGWNDPANAAAGMVTGDIAGTLTALAAALAGAGGADPSWLAHWRAADAAAARAVAAALADEAAGGELSESAVVHGVLAALPAGEALVLANSLAVREVDLVSTPGATRAPVLAARGVAGIDGTVATAAGAAAGCAAPVTALLGDLALLHDLGSLATLRHARAPVTLVVLANDGGRLFELLPLAAGAVDEGTVRELFVAPQGISFAGPAAAFGVGYHYVDSTAALAAALEASRASGRHALIEARTHARPLRQRRIELRERARALAGASRS